MLFVGLCCLLVRQLVLVIARLALVCGPMNLGPHMTFSTAGLALFG